MKEYIEKARCLHSKGYNCAQAVVCAFADKLNIDEQLLFKISEGFGLGMGAMQSTCGAVSGAIMIAGLLKSGGDFTQMTKGKTYKLSKQISDEFIEKNQSIICKELKGVETGNMLRSCSGCIDDAVEIVYNTFFND